MLALLRSQNVPLASCDAETLRCGSKKPELKSKNAENPALLMVYGQSVPTDQVETNMKSPGRPRNPSAHVIASPLAAFIDANWDKTGLTSASFEDCSLQADNDRLPAKATAASDINRPMPRSPSHP